MLLSYCESPTGKGQPLHLFSTMLLLQESVCVQGTGIPFDKQQLLRSGDYTFVTELGHLLKLSDRILCAANYLVNFFYTFRSYVNYDRHVVCTAALMLSCKLHDEKNTSSNFAKQLYAMTCKVKHQQTPQPYESRHETENLEKIFKAELKILKTIQFDLEIDVPLNYIDDLVHRLFSHLEDRAMLLNISRAFGNECMRSIAPLCIQPRTVAVACVLLAGVVCQLVNIEDFTGGREVEWAARMAPGVDVNEIACAMRLVLDALASK